MPKPKSHEKSPLAEYAVGELEEMRRHVWRLFVAYSHELRERKRARLQAAARSDK